MQRDELQTFLLPSGIRQDRVSIQVPLEDKISHVSVTVITLDHHIRRLMMDKARLILEIGAALDLLPDERESAILTGYYIRLLTMEKIADGMEYSLQHVYRLRQTGVLHLGEILTAPRTFLHSGTIEDRCRDSGKPDPNF